MQNPVARPRKHPDWLSSENVQVRATVPQRERWERAAKRAKKPNLSDWIREVLDGAAKPRPVSQ